MEPLATLGAIFDSPGTFQAGGFLNPLAEIAVEVHHAFLWLRPGALRSRRHIDRHTQEHLAIALVPCRCPRFAIGRKVRPEF